MLEASEEAKINNCLVKKESMENMTDEDSEEVETNDVFEGPRIRKGNKINIMGKIALTADGRGLSIPSQDI